MLIAKERIHVSIGSKFLAQRVQPRIKSCCYFFNISMTYKDWRRQDAEACSGQPPQIPHVCLRVGSDQPIPRYLFDH
jgi:hypothetical protein